MSRYKLIRSIYQGKNCEVLHGVIVHPHGLGSEVAIKRLRDKAPKKEAHVRAFLNEARVGIALHHPNIVDVIRASSTGGEPEIVMQYLKGWTLATLLATVRSSGKPLAVDVAVAICYAMACGAAHMHERGLVHHHITPGNVMLTTDGCTKLIDFGGAIAGKKKPASRYTAPEFFRDKKEMDGRGDVYSIGAILYELTTGQVLFAGEGKPIDKILRGDYVAPTRCRSDFPGLLAAILKRSMALDPKARYQDIEAFLESLEHFAADMRHTLSPRLVRSYTQRHLDAPVGIDKRRVKAVAEEALVRSTTTPIAFAKRKKAGPPPIPQAELTKLRLATA